MRYYKEYDKAGKLMAIGTGDALNGFEITEDEYNALNAEMDAKAEYTDRVYYQEISIDDVPAEWREEVQANVDAMIAEYGEYDPDQISDTEALAIIQGVIE